MHRGVKKWRQKTECSSVLFWKFYDAELHYYYTKYIRTNKNNKSKRNTLVQIDLMNVLTRTLKMAPFDRLNAVLKKKQKWWENCYSPRYTSLSLPIIIILSSCQPSSRYHLFASGHDQNSKLFAVRLLSEGQLFNYDICRYIMHLSNVSQHETSRRRTAVVSVQLCWR